MIRLILFLLLFVGCAPQNYELIIRNGTIHPGNGKAPFQADLAIKNQQIVKIKANMKGAFAREIDATGLVICPGFIDIHAHLEPLPIHPKAESHVRQGVTTALGGPDGSSPLKIGKYLDSLANIGIGLNVAYLIGHNAVRAEVMGLEDRAPTSEELEKMKGLIENGMKDGAFGLSTGLKYLPGTYAELDEIVTLSKVAAAFDGIYTSHLREEGLQLFEGVAEAITIAEQAQIPVVLTHHKVVGQPMWGSSAKTLAMVDEARSKGLDVMIDQYPYTASHTGISILIPNWAKEGDPYLKFAERCEDPVLRDSIKRGIIHNLINDRGGNDLKRVQFSKFNWKPELEGKSLYDWAMQEGLEPNIENGAELVIEAQLHRGAACIFHAMSEEDIEHIMSHPQTMIGSDGRLSQLGQGHPHPRAYSTFPRVLGHYVREKKVLDLQTAIYKMTGLPAKRMGLTDRGLLKEGNWADVVIFDPNTIIDKATFEDPHQYPEGIHFVIINGKIVVEKGEYHDLKAGKVLKRN